MKTKNISRLLFYLIVITFLIGCKETNYDKIKTYIYGIKVIDTHSHQSIPWRKKHNLFDAGLYLHADLISAGMPEYSASMEEEHDATAYWNHTQEYLRFCRAGSYYDQFIKNYKVLYGLEKSYLTKEDFLEYSKLMDTRYKRYTSWLDSCYEKLNIELMFTDRLWQAFDTHVEEPYFGYVCRIDQLVLEATEAAVKNKVVNQGALKLLGQDKIEITNLQSYLDYIDAVLEGIVKHNVLSLKIGLAYHRSLDFEVVDCQDAENIFQLNSVSKKTI